jgi:cytochrome P450
VARTEALELSLPDLVAWLERSRQQGQAHYDEQQRCWQVLGHPEVSAILADHATFLSDLGDLMPRQPDLDLFARGNFVRMDPPRHHLLRGLVSRAFSPRAVTGLAPRIAAVTAELLDAADERDRGRLDLIDALAYPLPVIVIVELLGLPVADRPMFRRWADALFDLEDAGPDTSLLRLAEQAARQTVPTVREMNAYLLDRIRAARAHPADDLTSRLVAAEADGQRLADEEIIGFVGLLLIGGHITTTATLGNAVLSLDEHPEAAAQVRADRTLLPPAIEETLRLRTPFPRLARRTATDAAVGTALIPAGDLVVAWLTAANRDERVFTDPDRFDLHRQPNPHLTFGHGIHFCIGAPLARLEANIALGVLLDRYHDIAVATDPPVRHRDPWTMVGPASLPLAVHPR